MVLISWPNISVVGEFREQMQILEFPAVLVSHLFLNEEHGTLMSGKYWVKNEASK